MTLFQPPEPPEQVPEWRPRERLAPPPPPRTWEPPAAAQQPPPLSFQAQLGQPQAWATPNWTPPPPRPPRPKGYYRRIDMGFTIALCALGVLGTIVAVLTALLLPASLGASSPGFFEAAGSARALTGMLWGHVALLLVTIGCSALLLKRKRTTFWLPLAAGVLASAGYWIVVIGYLTADHTARFVA